MGCHNSKISIDEKIETEIKVLDVKVSDVKVSEIKEEPCDETEELTIEMLKALPKLEKKAILKRLKKLIKKKKI